jgi:T5SS/PEP-CTERM-associated repeat protein
MVVPGILHAGPTWVSQTNGLWRIGSNWLSGRLPSLAVAGTTYITNYVSTNQASKIVTIDSLTPSTNLSIYGLTVSGFGNASNTLNLVDVGTNNPLTVLNGSVNILKGGALNITNSSLIVTGSFTSFNVWGGSLQLDGGTIETIEDSTQTNATLMTRIGRTNTATLTINSGAMKVGSMAIGESPQAQFRARGTVQLNGGTLKVLGELSLGDTASCTGIVQVVGGLLSVVNSQTNIMRVGNYGLGQLVVSNATAMIPNISVARHDGSRGFVTLLTGGVISSSDDFSIGRFSGATGQVFVADGQLLVPNQTIWVGREGIGTLTISNGLIVADEINLAAVPTNTARGTFIIGGGTTLVSSNFVVGSESNSVAQLSISAGTLAITNLLGSATFVHTRNSVEMDGGTMTADQLLITNSAADFIFRKGTLRGISLTNSTGRPFVVGDGTNAAILELLGGTFHFSDGLVISSNATVRGCGNIVGAVQNFGTLAVDCNSTGNAPQITADPQDQTVPLGGNASFGVTATGTPPLAYTWRFNGVNLSGSNTDQLFLNSVNRNQAGSYDVIVANSSGSVTSLVAHLRVLVPTSFMNTVYSGDSLQLSCFTEAGLNYTLQYKNELSNASWLPLKTLSGDGNPITFVETNSIAPSRFYRILVQ